MPGVALSITTLWNYTSIEAYTAFLVDGRWRPHFYPAVPIDRNLVRVSITAVNTDAEIDQAIGALKVVWSRLRANRKVPAPSTNNSLRIRGRPKSNRDLFAVPGIRAEMPHLAFREIGEVAHERPKHS